MVCALGMAVCEHYYNTKYVQISNFLLDLKTAREKMSLQFIRNMNLLATFAMGYIGLTSSVHSESIFLKELKECSKRIYEISKFIFYALESVMSMSRNGISGFFPKKVKSQQQNLFGHF